MGSTNDSYTYSGLDSTDRVQYNGASAIYSSLGLSVDGAGSSSATYYTRTNQGQLVNERTTSGTYYYLMDDLGSVLKVVDSSGNVKNSYYYDPYGNSLNKNETVSNPWQYASGYEREGVIRWQELPLLMLAPSSGCNQLVSA